LVETAELHDHTAGAHDQRHSRRLYFRLRSPAS